MPLTQAYADQLTELSTLIDSTFNNLYQEALAVFVAEEVAADVSKNPRLDALLSKPYHDLTPSELDEVVGSNDSHYGSRQRLFLLRQAWNEMTRLNQDIQERTITDATKLAQEIVTIQTMFDKSTAPFTADLFKLHNLSTRKINFVKSFIDLALRLLRKKLAVKPLLALNTLEPTPMHPENAALRDARKAYNEAFTKHNKDHLPTSLEDRQALNTLEEEIQQIEDACGATIKESKALETPSADTETLEAEVLARKKALEELLNEPIDNNTTFETLARRRKILAPKKPETGPAALLLFAKNAYESQVFTPTKMRINALKLAIKKSEETIKTRTEALKAQRAMLVKAQQEATKNKKKEPMDGSMRGSLATLRKLHQTLKTSINAEILALTTHSAALTALKTQAEERDTKAKAAYPTCAMLLADTKNDITTLGEAKTVCELQKSRPFLDFHKSLADQFKTIHDQHETNTRCLPINSSGGPSIVDTSLATQLTDDIKAIETCIEDLKKEKETIRREHEEQQTRDSGHSEHDMETLLDRIAISLKKYEQALTTLEKKSDDLVKAQSAKYEDATNAMMAYNKKIIELGKKIQDLQADQDEARFLKQRLKLFKKQVEEKQLVVDPELNPDDLLLTLQNIPITRAEQKKPFLKTGTTRLAALRKQVNTLGMTIADKTQSYHYRRKGTFIGGMSGIGLSVLILGGLVASIYLSFGIAVPLLILIGVAIAVTPIISGIAGRLFGLHKDKANFQKKLLADNNDTVKKKRKISKNSKRKTKLRAQSVAFLNADHPDLEKAIAAAAVSNLPQENRPADKREPPSYDPANYKFRITYKSQTSLNAEPHKPVENRAENAEGDNAVPSYPVGDEIDANHAKAENAEDNTKNVATSDLALSASPGTRRSVHWATNEIPSPPTTSENSSNTDNSSDEEIAETPSPQEEGTYSLAKGGNFGLFSVTPVYPQQMQRKTSEPVLSNANRL